MTEAMMTDKPDTPDEMRFVSADVAARAHVDAAAYEVMYKASVEDPDAFWGEHGKRLDWMTPYTKIKNTTFAYPDVFDDLIANRGNQ